MDFAVAEYEVRAHGYTEMFQLGISRLDGMLVCGFPDIGDIMILCPSKDNFVLYRIVNNILKTLYAADGINVTVRFKGLVQDQNWMA